MSETLAKDIEYAATAGASLLERRINCRAVWDTTAASVRHEETHDNAVTRSVEGRLGCVLRRAKKKKGGN